MNRFFEGCIERAIKDEEKELYTKKHNESFYMLLGMRTVLSFINNGEKYVKMINEAFEKYFKRNEKELNATATNENV